MITSLAHPRRHMLNIPCLERMIGARGAEETSGQLDVSRAAYFFMRRSD